MEPMSTIQHSMCGPGFRNYLRVAMFIALCDKISVDNVATIAARFYL